jgi:Fe-S cluster assembly protein SufD
MDFRAASQRAGQGDPAWLAALRANAASLASQMDWPNSRAERPWKYYDISGIGLSPETPLARVTHEVTGLTGGSNAAALDATAGTVVAPGTDRLTALHYAFLQDGVQISVPANEEAGVARITRRIAGGGLATPHTLIVTGANSRVTIVEEFISDEAALVALPVVEIVPGAGAEVRYYAVHNWGANSKVFMHQRFAGTNRDASFQNLQVVLGGEVVKGHLESSLVERGTSSELLGVAYGVSSEHSDFFTLQDHIGPDTRSDLVYKSALTDRAQAVYYGLTRVGLGAKNADAAQENRNLLLSKTARADSDPVLEILTADIIRASHGATAGPVDQEQLFYMQARGIPYKEAESMLVRAFLEEVFGRVPDESLREELTERLEAKLE